MLEKLNNLIEKLKNTNSQNQKLEILSNYKNDNDVRRFFRYCYDQDMLFGITSSVLIKNPKLCEFEIYDNIFQVCALLTNKTITGNKAIAVVNGFINSHCEYEELLYNFFDKNLKIGLNVTQINKVFNNLIPVFDVALAATYDEDKPEKYNLDNYFIQRKLNGLRLITIIEYNEGNIKFSFKSRKGKDFTTMGKIQSELEEIYKKSLYYGTDIVIDGEVCIVDENGKEDWNRIVSEAKRKNHIIYNPRYICFDIMTKEQFYGFKQSMKYSVRYDNLKKFLSNGNLLQHLRIVFSVAYNEEHFKKLCKEFIETDLWEGFIFRNNGIYKSGRSTELLKYKLFKDAEFIVIDVENTKKPILNEQTGLMEEVDCVGALIFEYKGNRVKVGSGLDDKQRIMWYEHPEWIIGREIQVKYKEETTNSNGTVSLQFPVLKYVFEEKRDF